MQESQVSSNMNVFQKIVGVFFEPKNTFTAIDQKPDWIAPLLVIIVLTLVFTMLTMPITLPDQMEKQRVKYEERGMSDEQIDQAMSAGESIGKIAAPISVVIGVPIVLLFFALIFWFVGNVVLGGQTTYIKMFSVYIYASLIGTLGLALKSLVIMLRESADVHFSLALLLNPEESETLLFKVLNSFDLFAIWQYAVLAIGFAVIYKFTIKKAGITMAVLFLITVVITVGLSQIF